MVQRLKTEVRERIVEAAEEVFAVSGYRAAKMADIAAEAGISTGNLYRYFPGKESLFHEVIDPDFVARFEALLDRRVQTLTAASSSARSPDMQVAADEMLGFWSSHRRRVVVLLDRCEGSEYSDFGERFVERLVALTMQHLQCGRAPLPELVPFTLTNMFHTSRRAVVSILETYETPSDIRAAFEAFWSFQLAGLRGFEAWVSR